MFRRLDRGAPQLVEVRTAADVVPGLTDRMLLHCGPRIEIGDVSDPLRRSMRAAICAEGWADTPAEADRLLTTGDVMLEPANDHRTVVPMATAMGPQTPVWVVQLPDTGITTYAPLGQGSGDVAWFGKDSQGAIEPSSCCVMWSGRSSRRRSRTTGRSTSCHSRHRRLPWATTSTCAPRRRRICCCAPCCRRLPPVPPAQA